MLGIESDPYSMFIFAMNAAQTRGKYHTRLFDSIDLPGPIMERCFSLGVNGQIHFDFRYNKLLWRPEEYQKYCSFLQRSPKTEGVPVAIVIFLSHSSLLSEFLSFSNVQGNHFPIIFFQSILMK